MISIVNTECHVPKTFSDLAKIAAWGRLGHIPLGGNTFKPYVGVGLGAVGSHLKALGEDDGSVRFAWQLRAGAAVKVTKRSEEHTSELQSLMRISYAVFCLKKKNQPPLPPSP